MEITLKPGLSHITDGSREENMEGIIWPQLCVEEMIRKIKSKSKVGTYIHFYPLIKRDMCLTKANRK